MYYWVVFSGGQCLVLACFSAAAWIFPMEDGISSGSIEWILDEKQTKANTNTYNTGEKPIFFHSHTSMHQQNLVNNIINNLEVSVFSALKIARIVGYTSAMVVHSPSILFR